ncbi:hypothetical protein Enr13x_27970 [Stieleria neptunia]|uniref:Helix-turn-helix domain-containing protein n=1 Tax=Stieleria neptunia TaxID=2527979 RepID=A0A518HQ28_9BACT|nr:hypothetical protein [Stieleria neptunia]QDV42945.1 hypothetical protein Enr13x_27970 [Stieleria neptunia]
MTQKQKSNLRWESGRHIHDIVLPSLDSTAQAAVLMFCWFHARGRDCVFDATAQQIGDALSMSQRHAKRVLCELETGGVVKTLTSGRGRGNPSTRYITGQPLKITKGDSHVTLSDQKGDTGVTLPKTKGDKRRTKRGQMAHEKGTPMSPTQNRTEAASLSLRDDTTSGTPKDERPRRVATPDAAAG